MHRVAGEATLSIRADQLRQIADLARLVQSAVELDGLLSQVTAAVKTLRPDLRCNIRLLDREAGGFRLVRQDGVSDRAPVLRFGEGLTCIGGWRAFPGGEPVGLKGAGTSERGP